MKKLVSSAAAVWLALWCLVPAVQASDFPGKPVKIIVGFAPGGASDVVARQLASQLGQYFKQPFVVENRVGASGTIAGAAVAKAAPDGYTLWLGAGGMALVQAMSKSSPYDMATDFAPVGIYATGGYALVLHPSVTAASVPELVALAKARPGTLNYGSAGPGTPLHLSAELFKSMTGTNIAHIPFSGDAPALAAVMSNTVQLGFLNMPAVTPQIRAGKLRALAVTTSRRSSALPELPTMVELGFKDFEVQSWWGLMAPAHTPPEVIKSLNAAMVQIVQTADARQRIASLSLEPASPTPDAFTAIVRADLARYRATLKATGIEAE
jgi:tripartite-type tricarboxylate transporter receptor subunit TctC